MTAGTNDPNFIQPFYLYDLFFTQTVYLTDADRYVLWQSNTYVPFPISFDAPVKDREPQGSVLRIGASGVDRSIAAIVLNEAPQGKRVTMRRSVWTSPGSYTAPVIVYDGKIDSGAIFEEMDTSLVSFEVRNDFALWEKSLPRGLYSTTCNWIFKSSTPGCQYTGAASLCNRTWERCTELSNTDRFRGFRHLSEIEDKEMWWGRQQRGTGIL